MQLLSQFFQLLAELALELEHRSHWLRFALGARRVESAAPAQHGLFNLACDDRSDFAEIFANRFDLQRCAQEELQIAFQVAGRLPRFGFVKSGADEVVDVHLRMFLPVTVNAAIALFHPIWVPRNFVMNELPAVILQVDAFGRSIRREQNADRRFGWIGLECRLHAFTVLQCHATVNRSQTIRTAQILRLRAGRGAISAWLDIP